LGTGALRVFARRLEGHPGRLYLVRRGAAAERRPVPARGRWTRVFANDALALDRLDGSAEGRAVGVPPSSPGGAP
jgi:hypothetical protein